MDSTPPPSKGRGRAGVFPSSAPCPQPPLSPCLFMDNEGEEDTRGRLRLSLSVSPPIPGPSEGGGGGRGAGEAAPDLDAGDSGGLAVGPVGMPDWRLDDLLRSA